jgi:hypothetical protein
VLTSSSVVVIEGALVNCTNLIWWCGTIGVVDIRDVAQVLSRQVEKAFQSSRDSGTEFTHAEKIFETGFMSYGSTIKVGFLENDDLKFFRRGTLIQESEICFYAGSLVCVI